MRFIKPLTDDDWRRRYFKWWVVMLILVCVVQTIPHAVAQSGGCGVWGGGEAQANRVLFGGAAVGALVGFLVGGPFGLGIVIGGLLVGGIAGANDIAMTMAGC